MLDVLDRGRDVATRPTPLLFVHGAFHGAWCWSEHFLDFFAERGYRAVAVNLRGHGNSPSPVPLNSCTLADYVDDVRTVADSLPRPPVVIGHSMGGAVVQKYLTVQNAPAGVLVASAPPSGLARAALRLTRRHPGHCARSRALRVPLRLFGAPPVARATFYSRHTPEQRIAEYIGRLQDESIRVLYRDLLYSDLPRPERVTTSMLVVGAELDGFFSPREVAATARAYGTRARMFPDMGHNMMLEPGWAEVAEYIYEWLDDRGL